MFIKSKKIFALLLSAIIAISVTGPAHAAPNVSTVQTNSGIGFTDMTDNAEFNEAITWGAENGITTGWSDGTFRPWNNCNRAAIITFFWRTCGKPQPSRKADFTDMTGNSEFDTAISWASENGITTGWEDGTFRPWNTCNRAATITFLWRVAGKPAAERSADFTDMTGNDEFDAAISWASEKGITTGWNDNTFRPWNPCNRAAVIAFLYRERPEPEEDTFGPFYMDLSATHQTYMGGYIEIQPDSWGAINSRSERRSPAIVTGDLVEVEPDSDQEPMDIDSTAWGFPYAFSDETMSAIKSDVLSGDGTGIMYIRFPLGFAYRGYRNIDEETGLAKNIGERWPGQNVSMRELFSDISAAGGGLAPEYWCPAPYWLTGDDETGLSSYSGIITCEEDGEMQETEVSQVNQLWAGGDYPRSTTLSSIRETDKEQYYNQIQTFTDAIIDDLEYLNQNIAPVRQFGLQNEPNLGINTRYGHCDYDAQTYNDVLEILVPKLRNHPSLANVKINVSSEFTSGSMLSYTVGSTYIQNHINNPQYINLYSWRISVRNKVTYHKNGVYSEYGKDYSGANLFKSGFFKRIHELAGNNPMFISEFEYMSVSDLNTQEKQAAACSNNMLRMIYELTYANAEMLHPIIHLAKPKGQVFDDMTYIGYSMFNIDMDTGEYSPNNWSYHSWKLFNDNLPIGAVLVGNYEDEVDDVGWAAFQKDGKIYLFMANDSDKEKTLILRFDQDLTLHGKLYDLDSCGEEITSSAAGNTFTFQIPSRSGIFWTEE